MRHGLILPIALLVALANRGAAADKIPLDQVPDNFLQEVKTTNPDAKIISVERSGNSYDFQLQRGHNPNGTFHVSVGGGQLRSTTYDGDNAPDWLTQSARKIFPNAKVVRVSVTDDSSLQMGIAVFLKDGQRNLRVNCNYGGGPAVAGAYSITRELAPGELPAPVARVIAQKHPRATIESVCEEHVLSGVALSYNIMLRLGDDHRLLCSDDKGNLYTDVLIPPKQLPLLREFPTTDPATTQPLEKPSGSSPPTTQR